MIRSVLKITTKYINDFNLRRQNIEIGNNSIMNGIPFLRNYGCITIGTDFKATSGKNNNPIGGDIVLRLICRKNALITIGNNVGISNSTMHICKSLVIEDNVMIGGGCKIWDSDFHSINYKERVFNGDEQVISKPIKICKNVFIGAGSIILKGVTIGENSVIGAGSIVTKSIPPNEIWAGNPAKKIKGI